MELNLLNQLVKKRPKMRDDNLILRLYVRETLNEASGLTHFALDLAGLIPGVGEAFDATNAALYMKEGKYLLAGLSLISCIPELGDLAGKGVKALLAVGGAGAGAASKLAAPIGKLLAKHEGTIAGVVAKFSEKFPALKTAAAAALKAVKDFAAGKVAAAGTALATKGGVSKAVKGTAASKARSAAARAAVDSLRKNR